MCLCVWTGESCCIQSQWIAVHCFRLLLQTLLGGEFYMVAPGHLMITSTTKFWWDSGPDETVVLMRQWSWWDSGPAGDYHLKPNFWTNWQANLMTDKHKTLIVSPRTGSIFWCILDFEYVRTDRLWKGLTECKVV